MEKETKALFVYLLQCQLDMLEDLYARSCGEEPERYIDMSMSEVRVTTKEVIKLLEGEE